MDRIKAFINGCFQNSDGEVLIKINHDELSGIMQTFERYEYKIIASFHKNVHQKGLDDRFDSFIRYLNI